MDKRFYSLTMPGGGECLVKEYSKNLVPVTEIRLKNYTPLGEREVFKLYRREGDTMIPIGVLEKDKGIFDTRIEKENLVVVRKNVDTDEIVPEFYSEKTEEKTEQSFEEFLKNFRWQRICGVYNICRQDIVDMILTEVAAQISRTGHYYFGTKEEGGVTYSIVAVYGGRENPFGRIEKYTFEINRNFRRYYAVCVGVDKTGEYFLINEK